jgi:hypothetical protein
VSRISKKICTPRYTNRLGGHTPPDAPREGIIYIKEVQWAGQIRYHAYKFKCVARTILAAKENLKARH